MEKTVSPWEQADIPKPGILSATEAYRAITDIYDALITAGKPATDETALGSIAKSIGCEPDELKLGGPAEIAKGNKPILVLTSHQTLPAHILNKIPAGALVSKDNLYAKIYNPSKETSAEAIVKCRTGLQGESPNHLIISEKLAQELGLNPQLPEQIVIETMYQKAEEINLDEL